MDQDLRISVVVIPGMDCAAEEQLVRRCLAGAPGLRHLDVDLGERAVQVVHDGPAEPVLARLQPLGLGAELVRSGPAPPSGGDRVVATAGAGTAGPARSVLWAALGINIAMFVVELAVGWWAQSTGLIADALDMLADAAVYGIALAAVGGSLAAQHRSARISGWLQLGLAVVVLMDVVRRLVQGSDPMPAAMMLVGGLALAANVTVVVLLAGHRRGGVHLRASWIFSVNDTLANIGVIAAGVLVALTGSQVPDLVAGTAIALLVASGAWRILRLPSAPPDSGGE